MDTIEELGGTYFYAGRTNLSASEMLFMVFCEETAHQLGIEDLGAIVAVVSGLNVSKTRGKFRGNIKDTSYASRGARKIFGKKTFPGNVKLPSVVGGYPPSTMRIILTRKMGTFVGRAVPVVGWIIIAKDITEIAFRSVTRYNSMARGNDKLW
ncbi:MULTISPECIES: STM2901 family protein [Serratia]|uniref:Phage membrane protein n=1 Tax=Serratia marcescens TaxID=615 RepID=A0ABX5NH49_SERMA|nr:MULTISPECIES: hypothetical protein [Serratia]AVU34996.1 hypothetical protein AM681_10295 [Serratia marcescens]AVU40100.1 hypothetical protein AS658_10130 [Serratia marcescens]EIJ7463465.1 hypothetical protein [Serratia marcescens]EIU0888721.1 hypothetical protein [Serratia marcescens]EJA2551437.1 hypothetical protein [Serratia marcescens]